jgi:hypothetical protein
MEEVVLKILQLLMAIQSLARFIEGKEPEPERELHKYESAPEHWFCPIKCCSIFIERCYCLLETEYWEKGQIISLKRYTVLYNKRTLLKHSCTV